MTSMPLRRFVLAKFHSRPSEMYRYEHYDPQM